jgi:hypothetical protein
VLKPPQLRAGTVDLGLQAQRGDAFPRAEIAPAKVIGRCGHQRRPIAHLHVQAGGDCLPAETTAAASRRAA